MSLGIALLFWPPATPLTSTHQPFSQCDQVITSVGGKGGRQHIVVRRGLDHVKLARGSATFATVVQDSTTGGDASGAKAERSWKLDADGDGLGLDDLVNRLDSFQMLRNSTGDDADQALDKLGATSDIDREIVLQLGAKRPLGHPLRFEEAHGLAVRSLEVLDRNGHRAIPVKHLGFLSPVVGFLVQIVTQFIVRSYIGNVIDSMNRLYERREAASPADWEYLPMLTRARIHTARILPGFKRSKLALPGFLFGGVILSPLVGVLQGAISSLNSNSIRVGLYIVVFVLLSVVSWVLVKGSAVARRRIQLTAKTPIKALYEVIGRCGNPPGDMSTVFAVISLVLTIVSLVIVAVGIVDVVFFSGSDDT